MIIIPKRLNHFYKELYGVDDMDKMYLLNEIKIRKEMGLKVVLECVDEDAFIESFSYNKLILDQGDLVVESIINNCVGDVIIRLEGSLGYFASVIHESEIHLFRIKNDEGLPKDWNGGSATHVYIDDLELISELMDKNERFYNLVGLSYQAWKDGFIERILLEDGFVEFEIKNNSQNNIITITYFRDDAPIDFYHDVIQELERLYYEEFVIDNEEDMNLISDGDRATLTNGNEITIEVSDMGGIRRYGFYDMIDGNRQHIPLAPLTFTTLKGATIKRRLNYGN